MKRRLAQLAVALSVGVTSCNADRITSSARGLALEVSISDASIGSGETATVTYRLRNVSRGPLTISVNCGMLPFIKDVDGAFVYPADGMWFCTSILLPPITLALGEEITRTFRVSGGASPTARVALGLPRGRYTIHVEFGGWLTNAHRRVQLRSHDVTFDVAD